MQPKFCTRCLAMSTRPRITFNRDGVCNACLWQEQKSSIDWDNRISKLHSLLASHRSRSNTYDVIVPVSGGKDGSYVAYNLKHKFNMNPLCVTVTPPLETELGAQNLKNFIKSGYDHVSININPETIRSINRAGFIHHGFPYFGWLVAIVTSVTRVAQQMNVPLIMYGEDAEMEYGGSSEKANLTTFGVEYMKRVGFEAGYEKVFSTLNLSESDLYWLTFAEQDKTQVLYSHWSYFENWDPYRNYLLAKKECGLQEAGDTNFGTFTNFAQNDQYLYVLHTYLMYLKFGFGRSNQDACIEIRRGAMKREQAINLVRLYDGQFPDEFLQMYLEYYQMSEAEFHATLARWVNKDLFELKDGLWSPTFTIN